MPDLWSEHTFGTASEILLEEIWTMLKEGLGLKGENQQCKLHLHVVLKYQPFKNLAVGGILGFEFCSLHLFDSEHLNAKALVEL